MPQKNNSLSAVEKRAKYVCFDDFFLLKEKTKVQWSYLKNKGVMVNTSVRKIQKFLIHLYNFTAN